MRTGGTGSEGMFVLLGVIILTLAGIAIMGGPYNFFQAANRFLMNAAESTVLWVRSHL